MDQLKIIEMCIRGGHLEATAGQGIGVAGLSVLFSTSGYIRAGDPYKTRTILMRTWRSASTAG